VKSYNVYRRREKIVKPLKNVVITFRVDENIKSKIDKIAEEREWSISQVVEKICKEYFKSKEEALAEVPQNS
jgi:predicted transcriptional regulator